MSHTHMLPIVTNHFTLSNKGKVHQKLLFAEMRNFWQTHLIALYSAWVYRRVALLNNQKLAKSVWTLNSFLNHENSLSDSNDDEESQLLTYKFYQSEGKTVLKDDQLILVVRK